jgi:hypothetical protein
VRREDLGSRVEERAGHIVTYVQQGDVRLRMGSIRVVIGEL